MAFQIPDQPELEQSFGFQRYRWIEEHPSHVLFTTTWTLALASIPLTVLNRFFMNSAIDERLQRGKAESIDPQGLSRDEVPK